MNVRLLSGWRDRLRARRAYDAAGRFAFDAHRDLARYLDPFQRALVLRQLAESHAERALVLRRVYGVETDPRPHRGAAALLRLLADVEHAVASGARWTPRRSSDPIEVAARSVLARMAYTVDLRERMDLLPDLYAAVSAVDDSGAALVLPSLPYPGAPYGYGRSDSP